MTRSLTLFLAVFTVLCPFAAPAAAQGDLLMYVGTNTPPAKGIYAYRFQGATGKVTPLGLAAETSNPTFLAVHPNQRFLYSVNEDQTGMLSAFAIDPASGQLKFLNKVSSKGSGPCHLSIDQTGKWLFTANYNDGGVAAYPINADGSLGAASAAFKHTGKSLDPSRQGGAHAHMAAISPDNRFVLMADLGLDQIRTYRLDPAQGGLAPSVPPFNQATPGSGPRHLVFRPDAKFAYVLGEISATVTVFKYDAAAGTMSPVQTISMLPEDYKGAKSGAEIALDPAAHFLYASNRGHDSIAIFKVDAGTGLLTAAGNVSTQGRTPRNFALDPSGRYLLAANQASSNVVEFKIDPATGGLTPTGEKFDVGSPVCITFVAPAGR